jgi:hypothetical protein
MEMRNQGDLESGPNSTLSGNDSNSVMNELSPLLPPPVSDVETQIVEDKIDDKEAIPSSSMKDTAVSGFAGLGCKCLYY